MTIRGLAFVEGATEEKFVREVLTPKLRERGVWLSATTPGRRRSQGGVRTWARTRPELLKYLKRDRQKFVTTMFDYCGMPRDWPGRVMASTAAHEDKARTVESAMLEDISSELGDSFNQRRFVPYIQMHEFEALLFSNIEILAEVIPAERLENQLQTIADDFNSPEEINDDPNSAPSKRIMALSPHYQKVLHGGIASQRIGLDHMRSRCHHFDEWVSTLEALAQVRGT